MKNFLLSIIIIALGSGVWFGLNVSHTLHTSGKSVLSTNVSLPHSQRLSPTPAQKFGVPKFVNIPKIQIATKVESVGMDSQGRMDIPKNSDNTAWFDLGYRPGQKGNAVLDGHYDKADGSGAVFWNISKLEKGDKIIVTDDTGKNLTFTVIRLAQYPYDTFPIKEVFGEANSPMLNLITCHGQWNKNQKNYSERLVVYSQLDQGTM